MSMKCLRFILGFLVSIAWTKSTPLNQDGLHRPWFDDADHYWDFDATFNNTVLDLKGNQQSKIIGDYNIFRGPKDNALELLGSPKYKKSYVILGDFSNTCLPDPSRCDSGFTITFWVNLQKVFNDGVLLQLGMSRRSRGITVNTLYKQGRIFLVFYGNTRSRIQSIKAELSSHIWHHVAIVWNATAEQKMSLFVNCSVGDDFEVKNKPSKIKKREGKILILGANHARKKATPIGIDDFAIWFKTLKQEKFCQIINQERVHGNYSSWSNFSSCSVTCGGGTKVRKRVCDNPVPDYGGRDCSNIGPSSETVVCNIQPCPITGGYAPWSNFSACSISCGGGRRVRTRNCTNPVPRYGGKNCSHLGPSVETAQCNPEPCPVSGGYTPWSNFSGCSVSCGGGKRFRARNCSNPSPKYGGENCSTLGPSLEGEACNRNPCPVHGNFSAWSAFSSCSTSCGHGYKTRNRTCSNPVPKFGGRNCSGIGSEYNRSPCYLAECPVDGGYSEWSNFTMCSKTCGNASKTRTRTCTSPTPSNGGQDCKVLGANSETVSCDVPPCPIHGNYSDWSEFTSCEKTCGNSSRFRRRFCTNPKPRFGGGNCSALGVDIEKETCVLSPCPIHGNFSEWSEFSKCSATCGRGVKTRHRNCSQPTPMHGGNNCSSLGPNVQVVRCDALPCPVDGNYSDWSTFSLCGKTCGSGTQFRTRLCNSPSLSFGGKNCSTLGPSKETRICYVRPCPIHGNFSKWSEFSGCSKTCGQGIKIRHRYCTNPKPEFGGNNCSDLGPTSDVKSCRVKACPVHGNYSEWSSFGRCSKSCDNGTQVRRRFCTNPSPRFDGRNCTLLGPSMETRHCETHSCPDIDFIVKFKLASLNWTDELLVNSSKRRQNLNKELKTATFGLHTEKVIKEIKIMEYSRGSVVAAMEVIYYSRNFPGAVILYDAFYNDQRLGPYDVTLLQFTSTDVPTNAVQNLTALNHSSTSLILHWTPLRSLAGQSSVVGYTIICEELLWPGNVKTNKSRSVIVMNTTTCKLTQLKKYSWYGIRIAAMNRRGIGVPSSELIVLTEEDVPNASSNLKPVGQNTSSTSIFISWKAIRRADVNGILRGYAVFYKPKTSNNVPLNVTVNPRDLSAVLTDLKKYTEYEIQVAGFTSKGIGGKSATTLVYTDEDVPSAAPVFHSCGNKSSTSIQLQWHKVIRNHRNGLILGYYVYHRQYAGNWSWHKIDIPESDTYILVEKLMMFMTYSFQISAFTSKGEGAVSTSILVSTDEDVPCSAPSKLAAGSTNSTSIWLKWHRLQISCQRGILRGYVVFYKRKSESRYERTTVSPMSSEAIIGNLWKFTVYHIKVAGFTSKGQGPHSEVVAAQTEEDVPSCWPKSVHAVNTSSTSIKITWNPIPISRAHGILLGYRLLLRKASEPEWEEMYNYTASDVINSIGGLWKYTKYVLRVLGFTSVGAGKVSPEVVVWTDEDVPSHAPEQFKAINKSGPTSIPLTWKPVSDPFYIHGILLGYKIEFQMTHLAGQPLAYVGKIEKHTTGANTLSYVLTGLEIYAVYRIKIRALTVKGDGVSTQISAETCKCASVYRTNWWINPPYIYQNNSKISGIFPAVLPQMVSTCCGFCHEHTSTITRFKENKQGAESSLKSGVTEFRDHVSDAAELHFPMYGQIHQVKYYKRYEFIPLVESPGVVFLVLEDDIHLASIMLLRTVTDTLPIVILIIAFTSVIGIVFWFVESFTNKEQFPPSFLTGVYHGMWLSFVSMTAIGYGDKFPRSFGGRIIGILWILTGSIIMAIYTSIVTSHITTEVVKNELKLYGTKVAVIQNSSEHQLAVRKNARPDLGHAYNNLGDIYNGLTKGYVKGALVDAYVLGSQRDLFDNIGVRIDKIYDYSSAYGLVLAGESKKLQKCFREYVSENRKDIFQIIEANVDMIKESEVTRSVKRAKSLIDPTFIVYKQCLFISVVFLSFVLLSGVLFEYFKKHLKRVLCRKIAKDHRKLKSQLSDIETSLQYEMKVSLLELTHRLKELKGKHCREWKRWIKMKKSLERDKRTNEYSLMFSRSYVRRYEKAYSSPLIQLRKLVVHHNSLEGNDRFLTVSPEKETLV